MNSNVLSIVLAACLAVSILYSAFSVAQRRAQTVVCPSVEAGAVCQAFYQIQPTPAPLEPVPLSSFTEAP